MVQVVWSREALSHLVNIRSYIRQFSPLAAANVSARLLSAGANLADYPERGRAIRRNVRELAVVPPYLIRYRVEDDRVLILRIRHGAQAPS